MAARCYGTAPPGVDLGELHGKLIVIEGADGSGRSTQIRVLREWLEGEGQAVVDFGLRRSTLVSSELSKAKQGNILGHLTRSLFYATDFVDQMENVIVPALRAGFVVLCDRYIYTLMARDVVRGARREWVESLFSVAIVPDVVFYLTSEPAHPHRTQLPEEPDARPLGERHGPWSLGEHVRELHQVSAPHSA